MKKLKPSFFSFWIENYKVSFLFLFLIVVAGILAMITIPKESSPDIKFGIISISVSYPWVNPQDIDSIITEKIEKEIQDIEGISKITSNSWVWFSSVTVELRNGVDTRDTLTDIKDKVDKLSFPTDANDPVVQEISTSNELLFQALIYGEQESYDNFRLTTLARQIENDLEGKSGIESIDIGGAWADAFASSSGDSEYEIKVLISKAKLESLDLSLASVSSLLRSFNKNTPIGNYTIWELEYDFRFDGEIPDVESLENLIVKWSGISSVRLRDIATIKKEYKEDQIKSLGFYQASGYNYITLSVNKKAGDNVFSVSKSAKLALEEYLSGNPAFQDLQIKYAQDLWENIVEDYKNLGTTAIQTFILVFLTIFVFVGLRESMIASILLPLAFFITFISLNVMGLSLNFLTNFSLVLTLGIAIDTIIVIIEGASERQKLWFSRKNAVILAVQDLKAPLISGTATTLVAFLPMIFLPGIIGKFLAYIPITVFATLLAALILSLTLASALFYKLASKKKVYHIEENYEKSLSDEERTFLLEERAWKKEVAASESNTREKYLEKLGELYYKLLSKFIHSRKTRLLAIATPFILLVLSFVFLSPKIGFTLFPASDEGLININIEAKTGTDKEALRPYISQIEEVVSSFEEMKVYYLTLSGNSIGVNVELTDANIRQEAGLKDVFIVEEEILKWLEPLQSEWLKVEIATQANGPPTGSPVWVKLQATSANDVGTLKKVADDFKIFLQDIPGTKNVSTSSTDNPGQFVFRFDNNRLAFAGITPDDILWEIRVYFSGITAWSIKSAFEENDIILSIEEFEDIVTPEDIENLVVNTRVGDIRVGDYASFSFEPALSSINRLDGRINISVESELENGVLPTEVQPQLEEFAASYNYPENISFSAGGESSENSELIFATFQSFFISLFLIFTILVFQFNSYSQPLMILYSVVLALLWVNIGLFLTGNPYSMTFGIGFIALTGVVVNDAIILVDRINRNLDRLNNNFDRSTLTIEDYTEALVAAGKSRLQPIIVTTITTVFGVLPLALEDPFWAGLGFTIIFGLAAGSFMTLFIVPALYYNIYLKKKMREGLEEQT